ncbi:hypothetical protein C8R44DRAFT_748913 [Mycena epipterygia]|nr:hypothetical protein C8R44DRAFT_748913 [Mycena epipterygia]
MKKMKTCTKEELFHSALSLNFKENGVIPDTTRDVINNIVALKGVCPHHVIEVITVKWGVKVEGHATDRSVRRIVKEGGVASQMQFVEVVLTAKGVPVLDREVKCHQEAKHPV